MPAAHASMAAVNNASAVAVAWLRALLILGLFGLVAAANGNGLVSTAQFMLATGGGSDWKVFEAAAGTNPFQSSGGWHWSPVAAWLFVPIVPMGLVAWQALHVVALGLLPTWRLRAAVLLSWPFWWDVSAGNINTFIVIAAYWTLRRNQLAIFITLAIALLVPRPFEIALIAYVLWHEPAWRLRFAVMVVVNAILILASGQALEFAAALIEAGDDMTHLGNVAPSAFIGQAWMLIGAPLAVIAFRRGYIGVASLLANPYWLPYYLLLPILDLTGHRATRPRTRAPVPGFIGTVRDQLEDHWLRWLGVAIALGIIEGTLVGHTSALLFQGWRLLLLAAAGSLAYWTLRIVREARRAPGGSPTGETIQADPAHVARAGPAFFPALVAVARRLVEETLGHGYGAILVAAFGVAVSLAALMFPDVRVPAVAWLAITAVVLAPGWVTVRHPIAEAIESPVSADRRSDPLPAA